MEMQKAYEVSVLVEALKKQGVEEAEKVAKIVVVSVADWLRSSAELSSDGIVGHLDDLLIPVINTFEKFALSKIDLLDGQVDVAPIVLEAPEVAKE